MTLVAFLLLSCVSPDDTLDEAVDDTGVEDTGSDEPENVYLTRVRPLLAQCVQCHGGALMESELDLTDPLSISGASSKQSHLPLITPGDALNSYLWHKVNGSQSIAGGLGGAMPLGAPVTAEQIEMLGWWIDQGALNE